MNSPATRVSQNASRRNLLITIWLRHVRILSIDPPCVAGRRLVDVVVVVVGGWREVEVDVRDGGVLEVAGRDHRGVLATLRRVQGWHVEVNLKRVDL